MEPWTVIAAIRYAAPILTLLYFLTASILSVCTIRSTSLKAKEQNIRRDGILYLMLGVLCEYMIQALLLLVQSLMRTEWIVSQDEVVYLVSSVLVWGVQLLALLDSECPVWHPYFVNWILTLLFDIILLAAPSSLQKPVEVFDIISISIQSFRACNLLVLPCLFLALRSRQAVFDSNDAERQSLLGAGANPESSTSAEPNQNANKYGATTGTASGETRKADEEENSYLKGQREDAERVADRLKRDGNWWTYAKAFAIFIPYIWPVHSKVLQFRAILVGLCLITSNWLNLLIPRQLGAVTDALVAGNGTTAWFAVAVYAALTFANSGACIGWLQFWLWLPIEQYSYNALYTASHNHVMNLSADFHESRDANYIQHSLNRGGQIRQLTDQLIFNLIPMFIDLFLVFFYLYYLFGAYIALILAATAFFYLYTTAKLTALSAARRRTYIVYNHKEYYSSYHSVENWRTASYFNNIAHEHRQHCANIKERLITEKAYDMSIQMISVVQRLVMTLGLLGACFLAVYQVVHKIRSPGDFVVLLTYWAQLQGPLVFFSGIYKQVSEGMMDAERMLSIFQTKPSVSDNKDANSLEISKGEVRFNNVSFAYDERKEVLKSINLRVMGGSTVAIVGETGGGKSTVLRLLHRFYDVKSGSIEIDGQDIRSVTLKSLRDVIAVVPQDPTLFDDTIMNNVKYARLDATDEEVYEACKSAAIHEKIMTFPDKYQSKIGKNGVKLSGGEGQRVAIARAILKKAQIILLDEATSAVDTETEQSIQEAFKKLCHGRTTIIVAHRLSTIMGADRILVMKDGAVIEDGSHDDLIRSKGKYYSLWGKQILSDPAAPRSRPRSKSPHSTKALPLNDSDLESTEELSRILEETAEDIREDGRAVEENCNSTKVPKLKPDAPEFYPRHLQAVTTDTGDLAKGETKEAMKERLKSEKDQKKQEREMRKSQAAMAKKAAKNAGKLVGQSSDVLDSNDARGTPSLESSHESITSGMDNKDDKTRTKLPKHNNRRNQAKSEPSGAVIESIDGTNDSEAPMASSSGQGQPLLEPSQLQSRQVLAPREPSNGHQRTRSSSLGARPQHPRHWRFRGRRGDRSGSASTFGTTNSVDTSNNESGQPGAPATSPTEGVQAAGFGFASGSK